MLTALLHLHGGSIQYTCCFAPYFTLSIYPPWDSFSSIALKLSNLLERCVCVCKAILTLYTRERTFLFLLCILKFEFMPLVFMYMA